MNLHSGYPYWLIKEGLPFTYPKPGESLKADVVIMGGGISGALLAYHLVEAGVHCILADARSIGLGSTCASTGLLQYEIDTPLCELKDKVGLDNAVRAYKLCAESIKKISAIAKKIGFKDVSLEKSLYYAAYKKDEAFLKEEYAIRKQHGFKVNYLSASAVQAAFHFTSSGAILSDEAGQVNAYAFTHALLQYSIGKGLIVFDRTNINKIQHNQAGVSLTTDTGFSFRCKKLMYATGYEAVKYIDKKIVDLQSTYACISEEANYDIPNWNKEILYWNTADPYLYMRTHKRRIVVGGRDEEFYNPIKRDKLLTRKIKQLSADFNRVFPQVTFKPEFSWSGTFGSTKDGLPFIGHYKPLRNSLFALGFGGNGITFSLIAAEIITDIIKGKPNNDEAIFSFDRL